MAGTLNVIAITGSYDDLSSKPTIPTPDSGWTANSGVGDKTVALANYSNGINGTMVSALNVVSSGTGTALSALADMVVNLTKKVQAMETAAAANKLANA